MTSYEGKISSNHLHHVALSATSWSTNSILSYCNLIVLFSHTQEKLHFSVFLVFFVSVIMEDSHHHLESQSHRNHQHNDILPSTSLLLIIVPIIIIILLVAISLLIVMLKRIQSAKYNGKNSSKSRSVVNNSNCIIDIHSSPGNNNLNLLSFIQSFSIWCEIQERIKYHYIEHIGWKNHYILTYIEVLVGRCILILAYS